MALLDDIQRYLKQIPLPALILAGGLGPLAFALTSQYAFGLPPCHFCLLQRYPYLLVVACGVALYFWPQQRYLLTAFAIIGWLATGAIGLYHTGIETGMIAYDGSCVAETGAVKTLDALRAQIFASPLVTCEQPLGTFLGLSMASWNSISVLFWIGLTLAVYRRRPA
jgi:disulfide bond formation protein DsbB